MSVPRKTILVVDAEEPARERLAQALKREARVLRAASAEAGLALMEKEDVSLLVASLRLPGISGFDLIRIVRENYPLAEVVVLSDATDVEAAAQAVRLGAYHVLHGTPNSTHCDRRWRTPPSART
jgi:DNA-binding NtrC family response regulator